MPIDTKVYSRFEIKYNLQAQLKYISIQFWINNVQMFPFSSSNNTESSSQPFKMQMMHMGERQREREKEKTQKINNIYVNSTLNSLQILSML